jgi:hypothetical protein
MAETAAPAASSDSERNHHRLDRRRVADQPNRGLGDKRQRALAADDHAGQVEFGVVERLPAGADDAPVGQHRFDAGDVVGGDAVLETVWPARVFADVAAEQRGSSARRVGRVVEAQRFGRRVQRQVDDAALHDAVAPGRVQLDDLLHARKLDDHAAAFGHSAARQPSARAARHTRQPVGARPAHQLAHVSGCALGRRPRRACRDRSRRPPRR